MFTGYDFNDIFLFFLLPRQPTVLNSTNLFYLRTRIREMMIRILSKVTVSSEVRTIEILKPVSRMSPISATTITVGEYS